MKISQIFAATCLFITSLAQASAPISGTNYQSPYCGCCKEWVKHMEDNGFKNYSKEGWHFSFKNNAYPDTYFNFIISK